MGVGSLNFKIFIIKMSGHVVVERLGVSGHVSFLAGFHLVRGSLGTHNAKLVVPRQLLTEVLTD